MAARPGVGPHERNTLLSGRAATPGQLSAAEVLPFSACVAAPQLAFFLLVCLLPLCSLSLTVGHPQRLCRGPAHLHACPGHLSTPAPSVPP